MRLRSLGVSWRIAGSSEPGGLWARQPEPWVSGAATGFRRGYRMRRFWIFPTRIRPVTHRRTREKSEAVERSPEDRNLIW